MEQRRNLLLNLANTETKFCLYILPDTTNDSSLKLVPHNETLAGCEVVRPRVIDDFRSDNDTRPNFKQVFWGCLISALILLQLRFWASNKRV